MTNFIILAICIIVIISYLFDITSKYSKIPGVILLILLGIGIQLLVKATGVVIPNLKPVLPIIGTLGLIMIVMEASLDIELKLNKKKLILQSVSSAIILSSVFVVIVSYILTKFMGYSLRDSILNAIPVSIISSAVAIPAAVNLFRGDKEFIVYESSFSDIFGIMAFDFILLSQGSISNGIFNFFLDGLLTVLIALISTAGLAMLLHKTRYHVNYVIILTAIILVYSLAKIFHLPALLLILIFGLVLSNNQLLENIYIKKYVDFVKFRNDISAFKKISGELTFLVRSFFFIIFGFYTKIDGLFDLNNLLTGLVITGSVFLLRWLYFKLVLRLPSVPLVFFAPRGLITILLFLSLPVEIHIPLLSEEVITLVIFFSMVFLMIGNVASKKVEQVVEVSGFDQTEPGDINISEQIMAGSFSNDPEKIPD
jgi:Kef-type K+ transport system membrane component KefB